MQLIGASGGIFEKVWEEAEPGQMKVRRKMGLQTCKAERREYVYMGEYLILLSCFVTLCYYVMLEYADVCYALLS